MMNAEKTIRQLTVDDIRRERSRMAQYFYDTHRINFPESPYSIEEADGRWQTLIAYMEGGQASVLGLLDDSGLLGFIWYFIKPDGRLHINEIIVGAEHRSKGYGSLLLEALFELGKAAGVAQIELFVTAANQAAVNLYDKYHFKVERLLMTKDLGDDLGQLSQDLGNS